MSGFDHPSFHVGLALLLGMAGQVLARHLRIPGIVVLLALGLVFGPDGGAVLDPSTLGEALPALISFVVAIILFEGGMALDLREVFHQAKAIRRLVTLGAAITALGGALAVHLLLGWEGPLAVLFGTLVIVTGPTVIQPLLRRIRVSPRIGAILEGEAILGDAVGATIAVVALELSLAPNGGALSHGWTGLLQRLGIGVVLGLLAGGAIVLAVRYEKAVPKEIRNALALALLVGFYQAGEALRSECGIVVAITAGLLVGNLHRIEVRGLQAFKEELTTLFLGLLFVLLAADVRLAEIRQLGWPAVGVVAVLMFAVRPLNVFVSTAGSDLRLSEKLYLSWLAPRGIVAAAVASYFVGALDKEGIAGGSELRALVFLVIAVTVTLQGLTGGWIARRLGVARPPRSGWAILGANALGLALAERLGDREEIVLVDASSDHCDDARAAGFTVVEANALEESTLLHPAVEGRLRFVAVTPNEEVNFIFSRRARELLRASELWIAVRRHHKGIRPDMIEEIRARTLFGGERRLELWALRLERGLASIVTYRAGETATEAPEIDDEPSPLLPLIHRRDDAIAPFASGIKLREGDEVDFAIFADRREQVESTLAAAGWAPA